MFDFEPTAKALEIWQDLIGVRADEGGKTIGDWHEKQKLEALREAFELDQSEISGTLLLRYYLSNYLKDQTVTLDRLLTDSKEINDKLNKIKLLKSIVERDEVKEHVEDFTSAIKNGLAYYGVEENKEMTDIINNPEMLGILRRDALKSLSKLKIDQFFDGEPEKPGVRPVYQKMVHQWWNINSMLEAALYAPSGVSLNLIREPNDYHSFFAFLIKNGSNVFVLSDVPEFAHPMQGMMSRRPDRQMSERIAKNWFPYDLLNVAYDEDGRLYFEQSNSTALVAHQAEALPVKPISAIGAAEVIWTLMMFDLIVDRFWKKGYKAPTLSYTGEMVKVQDKLLKAAEIAGLPVANYKPINVEAMTAEEASRLTEKDGVGAQPLGANNWLEERYRDEISEEAINLVASPDRTFLITDENLLTQKSAKEIKEMGYFDKKRLEETSAKLQPLDATSFGSKDQLLKDRAFMIRYNYAKQIDHLAHLEFEQRKKELLAWYHNAVEANREVIISMAGNKPIWIQNPLKGTFDHGYKNAGQVRDGVEKGSSMRQFNHLMPWKTKSIYDRSIYGAYLLDRPMMHYGKAPCIVTGASATWGVIFYPTNAYELSIVTGLEVSDFPDVLQHWFTGQGYYGNSILDRIDPMEWVVKNPWRNLDLRVGVLLSKRGFKEIAKAPLLPAKLEQIMIKNVPASLCEHDLDNG